MARAGCQALCSKLEPEDGDDPADAELQDDGNNASDEAQDDGNELEGKNTDDLDNEREDRADNNTNSDEDVVDGDVDGGAEEGEDVTEGAKDELRTRYLVDVAQLSDCRGAYNDQLSDEGPDFGDREFDSAVDREEDHLQGLANKEVEGGDDTVEDARDRGSGVRNVIDCRVLGVDAL